jgi:hypothetical protein
MPAMSMKNTMLSPAATDLGIGSSLPQQVQDNLAEEEKRKKMLGTNTAMQAARDLGLAPMLPTGLYGSGF